jgi:hypothetical protein
VVGKVVVVLAVVVVTPLGEVVVVTPVLVVVGDVVVVVGAVVVVEAPLATAMTGEMGDAVGVPVVTPDGVTVLFGYDVHVRFNGVPATVRVRLMLESCCMVMSPPDAVNGPKVAGGEGTMSGTSAVTGLGKVTLKVRGPTGIVAGVAPLASILAVACPVSMGEMAAAAEASACGRVTVA